MFRGGGPRVGGGPKGPVGGPMGHLGRSHYSDEDGGSGNLDSEIMSEWEKRLEGLK